MPARNDVVVRREKAGIEHALDRLVDHPLDLDRLRTRLRHLGHEGPLLPRLGHIVGRVVREHCHPVERAVVLREVHPALRPKALGDLPVDANPDDVRARELGGRRGFGEVGPVGRRRQLVDGHGREEHVVVLHSAVLEAQLLPLRVHGDNAVAIVDLLLGERGGESFPDRARPPFGREAERVVWSPRDVVLLEDDIAEDPPQVRARHPVPHPVRHHLGRVVRPHLEVVGVHKVLAEPLSEARREPVTERPNAVSPSGPPLRCSHHPLEAVEHGLCGEVADVVLHRVGNEAIEHPGPRFALVIEPAVPQEPVHHPIEVRVMRELDVTADVPCEPGVVHEGTGQATGPVDGFVKSPLGVPQLLEPVRSAKARGARADDHNAGVRRGESGGGGRHTGREWRG